MSKVKAAADRPARPPKRVVDGILLLDKPTGITSNRALQVAKRLYNAKKAGHTGSLDPLASGLLPLCFGQATKVSAWLLDADKEYEVELLIGQRTDTADADGQVVETSVKQAVTASELEAALEQHRGELDQVPPMYSALRKDGRRLYELAREGIEIEREPRRIVVYELEILRFDSQRPTLRVRCSKGTYVRSLVETIAGAMGTLGHVIALRRTKLGPFAGMPMIGLDELEARDRGQAALDGLLLGADAGLTAFPEVRLAASEAFYLQNGHAVGHAPTGVEGLVRVYGPADEFLGVGQVEADGRVAPKRLFLPPEKALNN